MDESKIKSFWNYYKALENQLRQTEQYVDHSIENAKMVNGRAFSNEFAKILLLTASEFEVIGKNLCLVSGVVGTDNANIATISDHLLRIFPNIKQTIISTPYISFHPLAHWKLVSVNHTMVVEGLPWWKAYNSIKHARGDNFKKANLSNCINALASLTVLELYLSQKALGNMNYISSTPHCYFSFNYGVEEVFWDADRDLPDFVS